MGMDDKKESMFEMELGVDIFDEANKKWPFMNPKLLPTIPDKHDTTLEMPATMWPIPLSLPLPSPPLKMKKKNNWTKHLKIGDIVDAADEQEKWYESIIRYIEIKKNRKLLYLHYIGWNKKWDEQIFADDVKRIAKRNTMTKGPHRARRSQSSYYHQIEHFPSSYSKYWTAPKVKAPVVIDNEA